MTDVESDTLLYVIKYWHCWLGIATGSQNTNQWDVSMSADLEMTLSYLSYKLSA